MLLASKLTQEDDARAPLCSGSPISASSLHQKEIDHCEKPLPTLTSDEQAEEFAAGADLTGYDLSQLRLVQFEFQPKSERGNMRLPPKPVCDINALSVALETTVQTREGS